VQDYFRPQPFKKKETVMKKLSIFTAVLALFAFGILSAQYQQIFNQPYVPNPQDLYTSTVHYELGVNYWMNDEFEGLTDAIKKVEFYGTPGNWTSFGWVPSVANEEEPFIVRFYGKPEGHWTEPKQPLLAPVTGTYTVRLFDRYLDGWDYGYLDVMVNGVVVLDAISLGSGPEYADFTFFANEGDEISTRYAAGDYADENWYEILDPDMNVIATDGGDWVAPVGIFVPEALFAPVTGTYTLNLYDEWGDGWSGGRLSVYVDGVLVLENLTISSGTGPDTYTFFANAGDELATIFVPGGWAYENSYEILDPDLNVIAVDGETGAPVGLGFVLTYLEGEMDWDDPDYMFYDVMATTTFVESVEWEFLEVTWNIYKYEIELPDEVDLQEGWFSVQAIAYGDDHLFMWAPGSGGNIHSYQYEHYGVDTKVADRNLLKDMAIVRSGNSRDDIDNDMALAFYAELHDVEAITIYFITNPATPMVAVYHDGELVGHTNEDGIFAYNGVPEDLEGSYHFEGGGRTWEPLEVTDPGAGDQILVIAVAVTPVELSSFTATVNAINKVELNWVSQSENHMTGYRVHRNSSPNQSGAILITPVLIPATNTSTAQSYRVTDNSVEIGQTYHYWLEAVDYLGSDFHGPVSVTVEGNVPPVLPEVTSMKNAYPNPFKAGSRTNIEVALKAGESGELSIYNLNGQLVRSYTLDQGSHSIVWNGKDQRGATVGSGIYFYKLQTPSFNQIKKMVIMK